MTKQMTCALEIAKWLAKNDLTGDLLIYVNGMRYTVSDTGKLLLDTVADPKDYFDYAGDFMSMSFEGEFHDVVNNNWMSEYYDNLEQQFSKILEKYGKYYELGNTWNLSLYDI